MIAEDSIIDQVTAQWVEDSDDPTRSRYVVNVRRSNRVLRDGKVISVQYHRHVVEADAPDMDKQAEIVQEVAAALVKVGKDKPAKP